MFLRSITCFKYIFLKSVPFLCRLRHIQWCECSYHNCSVPFLYFSKNLINTTRKCHYCKMKKKTGTYLFVNIFWSEPFCTKCRKIEMQRINGTPFMRQKCIPLPHRQPQVNVMDLCFCIKDVIFKQVFFGKQNKWFIYIYWNIVLTWFLYQIQDSFQI